MKAHQLTSRILASRQELEVARALYKETAEEAEVVRRRADGERERLEAEEAAEARRRVEEEAAALALQLRLQREEEERIALEMKRAEVPYVAPIQSPI